MDRKSTTRFENGTGQNAHAARAPLALGVSLAVILAGAGFLTFALSRPLHPGSPSAPVVNPGKPLASPSPLPDTAAAVALQETPVPPGPATVESVAADESVAEVGGLQPRLAPNRLEAAAGVSDGPETDAESAAENYSSAVMTLGEAFLAADDDRPAPFFFEADLDPAISARAPLPVEWTGDVNEGPRLVTVSLARGETFVDAMRRAGVRSEDRNAAAYAFGAHQNLRTLLPGQDFHLTISDANQTLFQSLADGDEPQGYLLALEYKPDAGSRIIVKRDTAGGFTAEKQSVDLTSRLLSMRGRIGGSLFMSAKQAGAPDLVIADFANVFAYDVDFQREIFGGDEFEAIFEASYDENGALIEAGDILFARLKWRGRTKEKSYYRFTTADGKADYFDATGQSAKRLLMKTPIDGARLSSGFGTRRHPILGYAKAHKGVDFAAPRGTPIKAAGDGVIERASPYGSFGNYIRIRHANGYQTAYAHLNGFARGVRAGKRLTQGDIIGYVGTTGRSTGPHLHYEVHYKGQAVNPQNLKIATGVQLKGAELERFKSERDRLEAMRGPAAPETPGLLAQEDGERTQL